MATTMAKFEGRDAYGHKRFYWDSSVTAVCTAIHGGMCFPYPFLKEFLKVFSLGIEASIFSTWRLLDLRLASVCLMSLRTTVDLLNFELASIFEL